MRVDLFDAEAEETCIGLVHDAAQLDGVDAARAMADAARLAPADFHDAARAETWAAALALLAKGRTPEPGLLWDLLRGSKAVSAAGGAGWLAKLLGQGNRSTPMSFPSYAGVVRTLALRRRAVETLRGIAAKAANPAEDINAVLTQGAQAWQTLANRDERLRTSEADIFTLGEHLDAVQRGEREPVLPTGIELLDDAIGGLPRTLTIIGALPGVGKSALIATMLRNIARSGRKVGLFSLEDERTWVARRFLAAEALVPVFVLARKPLTPAQRERTETASDWVYRDLSRIVIDDRCGLSPEDVVQAARDMVLNHGCQAVFVDHLGEVRLKSSDDRRHDLQVTDALSQLRDIAKQYGVPVVVACHVRRRDGLAIENEPRLTDFANSAGIERMARVALGLSKPTPQTLRVSLLKQTEGQSNESIDLELNGPAGMVVSRAAQAVADSYQADEAEMLARGVA